MSSIILNGKEYNDGISDIVEITQSAYNALPATKYTDNVLYCISDSVDGVDAYPPLIYSDEEREVGVWRDGKPLYQKTITFDCSNTSNVQTAYSIPTTHFIVAVLDAYFENSYNNLSQQFRYTWYKDHFWSYIVNNSGHAISVHRETTDGNWQSGVRFIVTIQYTKTTDIAGGGKWNGQGGLAHHYSTSEKIIGTWIDGEPLYEITVHTNDPAPTGTTEIERTVQTGYDTIKYIYGVVPSIHLIEYIESTGTQYINTGILADTTTFFEIDYEITATTSYATLVGADRGGSRRLFLGVCSNGINKNYFYAGTTGGEFTNSYNALNVKTKALYSTDTLQLINTNGTITRTVTSSGISALDIPLCLFALNRNGSITDYSKLRIYSVKITKNNTLVMNAVPAKDENNVACLYDYVSGSYIYNSGSGAFVAGPDAN